MTNEGAQVIEEPFVKMDPQTKRIIENLESENQALKSTNAEMSAIIEDAILRGVL